METAKCAKCGCESLLVNHYRTYRGQRYCPRCAVSSESEFVVLVLGIGLLLSVWLSIQNSSLTLGPFWVVVIGMALFWIVGVVDEVLHAVTTLLCGGRTLFISFGVGPVSRSFQMFGSHIVFRRWGLNHYRLIGFPGRPRIRLRWALSIALPSVMELSAMLWLFAPLPRPGFLSGIIGLLTLLAFGREAFELFPSQARAEISSGGKYLMDIFRGKLTAADLHVLSLRNESIVAYINGDFGRMQQQAQAGVALNPNDFHLYNLLASALLAQGRSLEALNIWDDLLGRQEVAEPCPERSMLLTNRALTVFQMVLEDENVQANLLAEAYRNAAEAFALTPWVPSVETAQALSLYFQGQEEGARQLVEHGLSFRPDPHDRALLLGVRALIEHATGHADAAMLSLREAQRIFTPQDHFLTVVQVRIGDYPLGASGESHP